MSRRFTGGVKLSRSHAEWVYNNLHLFEQAISWPEYVHQKLDPKPHGRWSQAYAIDHPKRDNMVIIVALGLALPHEDYHQVITAFSSKKRGYVVSNSGVIKPRWLEVQ